MSPFYRKNRSKGKKKAQSGSASTQGSKPSETPQVSHLLSLNSVKKAKVSKKRCSEFVEAADMMLNAFNDEIKDHKIKLSDLDAYNKKKEDIQSQIEVLACNTMFRPNKSIPHEVSVFSKKLVNDQYTGKWYIGDWQKAVIAEDINKTVGEEHKKNIKQNNQGLLKLLKHKLVCTINF